MIPFPWRRGLLLALALLALTTGWAAPVPRIRLATWNVENLFDADDDPNSTGDDEFLPTTWRRWTAWRYARKLTNLAHVVVAMRPDILAVQEAENRRVLEDLVLVMRGPPFQHAMPHIAHQDSGDSRGIDVAILSRFPHTRKLLREDVQGLRGALLAHYNVDGAELAVIACHWKSRLGDQEENHVTRLREALTVRAMVERLWQDDPHVAVVVAGDFNDNLDGHALQQGLLAFAERHRVLDDPQGRLLYNVLGEVAPSAQGTYYFARQRVWNTFDTLIVPPAMLRPTGVAGAPWRLAATAGDRPAVAVFRLPEMQADDGRPKPFRRVRLPDGTRPYVHGYSDHFPVYMDLVRSP